MVRSDNRLGQYLMLAPLGVSAVLVVLLSLALIVALSLQRVDPTLLFTELTLTAYRENVLQPLFWRVLARSIAISAAVTAATLLLSYPVAYFIAVKGGRHKALMLVLITAPFFTSYLLRIFAWKIILGDKGIINTGLYETGLRQVDHPLPALIYSQFTVMLVLTYAWVPFICLPIFIALENMDKRLLEAATDLGASRLTALRKVTLPIAAPGIVAAFLFVFIPSMGEYVTPSLVGGTDGYMYGNAVFNQFLGGTLRCTAGCTLDTSACVSRGLPATGQARNTRSRQMIRCQPHFQVKCWT